MSSKDYWAFTYSLNMLGNKADALSLVAQLSAIDSSTTADYWRYRIEKSNGNTSTALKFLEESSIKNNNEVTEVLQQSLALTQRDYYEAQFKITDHQQQNRTLSLVCVTILSLLIIIVVIFFSLRNKQTQKEEKERYLRYAGEIKRQLEYAKNEEYPALKRKYLTLYSSKFETIGSLLEQYIICQGKKNAEHIIYKKVTSLVDEFRHNSEDKKRFESIINEDIDNIMQNLRTEMPRLKEMDYTIFGYMVLGFDSTTISHLLNTTINTIYIRKSRMRQRIEEISPKHKADFLSVLDV
jgi:hypothetical protein